MSELRARTEAELKTVLKYDVLIADIVQDYSKFNKYINVLPFYRMQ